MNFGFTSDFCVLFIIAKGFANSKRFKDVRS